jgi:poly-gamma-glutamate capsule biosynthesis protein CapA/YwtB (metallophosphatase superfamily)
VLVVGCGGRSQPAVPAAVPSVQHTQLKASAVEPVKLETPSCAPDVPRAACEAFRAEAKTGVLSLCAAAPTNAAAAMVNGLVRIGEWRYALVAPMYSPIDDVSATAFGSMWRGEARVALSASPETIAVLSTTLGSAHVDPIETRPAVRARHWALVPADELMPAWKIVTVGGGHPLRESPSVLDVGLCATTTAKHLTNLDPADVTTFAMTGVTAMARYTAKLMDRKGTTYPTRDIASWFEHTDYVHISNEVSFVPDCTISDERSQPFCSRESYIELMEAMHTNIVELDGSHLIDWGSRWLTHTIEMYEQRGWHFFGGGRNQTEAARPLLLDDKAGTKLALVGCNMPHSTGHWIQNRPDVGYCDMARLKWQIADLRHRGYTPIVSIQHEEVYTHRPPDVVVHDFRELAAAGAAIVFGSQAHYAHPFEVVDGAFVHYGAGNLFFDQSWKGAQDATNDRFYFVRGRLLAVDHLFTRLEEAGRPRPMHDDERAGFLKLLDDELDKLPHADPWKAPREVTSAAIPDSFIIGKQPVLIAVTLGDSVRVTLRHAVPLERKHVVAAITDFVATKYAVDPKRVNVR